MSLAYDGAKLQTFCVGYTNSRVLVFNVASITTARRRQRAGAWRISTSAGPTPPRAEWPIQVDSLMTPQTPAF